MPKRIVRIINRLNVGGPTYNVAYLSKFLAPKYETTIFSGRIEADEASSEYILNGYGLQYQYISSMYRSINPFKDYRAYRLLRKKIKALRPEIVHTHAAKAGALGRLAARSAGVKIIVHTYHGNVFDGYFSPLKTKIILMLERYLCKISTAVIAISEEQKNDLVYKYQITDKQKVHVIPLGFDLSRFQLDKNLKRKKCRDEFGFSDEEIIVTIVGRLAPIKNHSLFFQAVAAVKNRGYKFRCLVVGDGELYGNLTRECFKLGLNLQKPGESDIGADVIFTSWRKDIDVLYAGSDIVALSSLNEGTPVSLIEALAAGVPVVSTNVGGVPSVVQHNVNGLLAHADVNDFANKLSCMMSKSERERLRAATESSATKFSYERLVTDIDNLYSNLSGKQI